LDNSFFFPDLEESRTLAILQVFGNIPKVKNKLIKWLKTGATITFAHRKKYTGTSSCPTDLLMLSPSINLRISLGSVCAKYKDKTTSLLNYFKLR